MKNQPITLSNRDEGVLHFEVCWLEFQNDFHTHHMLPLIHPCKIVNNAFCFTSLSQLFMDSINQKAEDIIVHIPFFLQFRQFFEWKRILVIIFICWENTVNPHHNSIYHVLKLFLRYWDHQWYVVIYVKLYQAWKISAGTFWWKCDEIFTLIHVRDEFVILQDAYFCLDVLLGVSLSEPLILFLTILSFLVLIHKPRVFPKICYQGLSKKSPKSTPWAILPAFFYFWENCVD